MAEKFYGVKLTDMTGKVYYTEVDVKQSLKHTTKVLSSLAIDRKYPRHTIIGNAYYWSGSATGSFENNQGECEHDYIFGDTEFRIDFIEWLHNGLVKTMYLSDKLILPVMILGEINAEPERTIDDSTVPVSFQWEQCGPRIDDPAKLQCPDCGQLIISSTRYCPNCGKAVNGNG